MGERAIISRAEARAAGLKRFYTEEACSHGHVSERYVGSYECCACADLKRKRRADYHAKYRADHKAEALAYNHSYYAENADQLRDYAKRYRQENAETVRAKDVARNRAPERTKARAEANRKRYEEQGELIRRREQLRYMREDERIKARVSDYRKANPEKVKRCLKAGLANRRALMRMAEGKIGQAVIGRLYREQCGLCAFCSADISGHYHLDHILPLKRGGSNLPENLQLLCQDCNLSKGSKTMSEWIDWLEQYSQVKEA